MALGFLEALGTMKDEMIYKKGVEGNLGHKIIHTE